jgi:putative transposase
VTLPTIGMVRVHDDTRRLRRLLRPVKQSDPDTGESVVAPRAKVLFATVSRHGSRWYVSLNVQAPDFHAERRHTSHPAGDHGGFIGVDRGLEPFVVAATAVGTEVGRWQATKPLRRSMVRLRRLSRAASGTQPRSCNRARATRRLSRHYIRIANVRRGFLHEVSSQLVKTHDRLCLEDLATANLIWNRRLIVALGDAAWTKLARQLTYKAGVVRSRAGYVRPLVCVFQDVLEVRNGQAADQIGRTDLSLRGLQPGDRSRPQRRCEPRRLGRALACPSPGPPNGRPDHQRPRRGRL